jgi:hypothetical protein
MFELFSTVGTGGGGRTAGSSRGEVRAEAEEGVNGRISGCYKFLTSFKYNLHQAQLHVRVTLTSVFLVAHLKQ